MSKIGKIVIMVLFVLLLVSFSGCFDPDPPDQPPDEQDCNELESDIQALLSFNGIDSVVQIDEGEVIVRYNQPEVYSEDDAFLHIGLILGTVSSIYNDTETIKMQIFIEEIPLTEITVDAEKFFEYRNCDITIDEFIKSWDLSELN